MSNYYDHLFITSLARVVVKYCDECVCLSVCLSVQQDISGTTRAIFTKTVVKMEVSNTDIAVR